MNKELIEYLNNEIEILKKNSLYKQERIINSPQSSEILVKHHHVINLCANNYLGLSNDSKIIQKAHQALDTYGYGMSSVRFICGTQNIHKELELKISQHLKTEEAILYSSCFDANTGLFETLLDERDAIISDELNHASIIDGIRLCKAQRFRYSNNNMTDLEKQLKATKTCRFRLIVTDGVFSMDGIFANLPEICELSEKYNALVMVDDSHAIGFIGKTGAGTPEYWNVQDKVDILTGTLGKALGGASGGYTAAKREIVEWLRQRSRPYLFSNSVAPVIVATSIMVLDLITEKNDLQKKLFENTKYFRQGLKSLNFKIIDSEHPIIPILIGDAKLSSVFADELLKQDIYVISFSYPVVPKDKARIRTQMSAAHSKDQLDRALDAFATIGKKLGLIF